MNRRQLLVGLAGLASGGGVITGTGAFTSVNADRHATVQVSSDTAGYLQIYPSDEGTLGEPNGTFATQTGAGNELGIDINDAAGSAPGSLGAGVDSRYVFDDVFRVRNEGTQDVFVQIDSVVTNTVNTGSGGEIRLDFIAGGNQPSFSGADVIDGSANEMSVPVGNVRAVGIRLETVDGSQYGDVTGPNDSNNIDSTTSTELRADADDDGSVTNVDPGQPSDILSGGP
jgi:hypothetical protein